MPPQAQILSDMVLANNYFTNEWPVPGCASCLSGNHASCIWTRGTYIEGSLALYRINHDTNIYNYAVQWGAFTNWSLRYGDTDTSPDDQCAGQEYIELYQFDTTQTNRLTHIVNNVNYWMSGGVGLKAWTYVDAIHMSMPAFAKLGVLNSNVISALKTNDTYAPMMFTNFHFIKNVYGRSNGLYNATDHLWWRDTNFMANYTASDGTKQKCYWSRGNGWAFVALARTMEVLPTNDPHYAEYLQTSANMAAAIKAVQRAGRFLERESRLHERLSRSGIQRHGLFHLRIRLGNQPRLSRRQHLSSRRHHRLERPGRRRAAPQHRRGQWLSRLRTRQRQQTV